MKKLGALILVAIVLIGGHVWRTDDEGEAQRGIVTIDDEVTDEFKDAIRKDVGEEFKKEFEQEVAEFEAGHGEGAKAWTLMPGGAWEPDASTLIRMRVALHREVRDQAEAQDKTLMDWSNYRYQYQGREQDGRRQVFVAASCMTPPEPPKPPEPGKNGKKGVTIVIEMDDEADACHFQALYDPEEGEFSGLRFEPAAPRLPVPPVPPAPPAPPPLPEAPGAAPKS